MKLSKAVELYWLDKKLGLTKTTIATYAYTFRYLVEQTNDKDIETITGHDIKTFVAYLVETRQISKRSVHDALARLSSLFGWASIELKIPNVIKATNIEIKFIPAVTEAFTQSEIRAILTATEYKRTWSTKNVRSKRATATLDKAIILVLLDCGIRAQELCSLTVGDYENGTGRLFIKSGKGEKPRTVILGNRTQKALYKYLSTRDKPKVIDPLFATNTNNFLQRDNLRHKLEKIGKAAEVANVHPHRFRHTFAINFLRNGGNILVLQQLLGHSTLEMVKHYAKIAEIDIDKASEFSVADNWRL